jgi:hypothetical protein
MAAEGGELHPGGEPALYEREIARGEMAVEVVDVGQHLEAFGFGQQVGIDPRPRHGDHAQR